jgi:predicted nucleotidyltransferase
MINRKEELIFSIYDTRKMEQDYKWLLTSKEKGMEQETKTNQIEIKNVT